VVKGKGLGGEKKKEKLEHKTTNNQSVVLKGRKVVPGIDSTRWKGPKGTPPLGVVNFVKGTRTVGGKEGTMSNPV